jgi:aryl-alcohol dehydrogenase-like predicted oxidoreductase
MQTRAFGATGLRVSAIGLGCARIGGIFQRDPRGFAALIRAAFDAGINFFDTADMYSQGESEKLLGSALAGVRDRAVIASKAGYVLPAQHRMAALVKPLARRAIRLLGVDRNSLPAALRGAPSQDFSPRHLLRAVEGSLRRLRTDRLDLFQLHSTPKAVIEQGGWLPAIEQLRKQGKVLHFGVACDTVDDALLALRQPMVASVQITINLLERRAVDELLPAARARNVAVIAREILANGVLVKSAAEVDLKDYCQSPEDLARRTRQLAAVRELAAQRSTPLARLALQFVEGLEGVSVALLGARTREQLEGMLRLTGGGPLPLEALHAVPA